MSFQTTYFLALFQYAVFVRGKAERIGRALVTVTLGGNRYLRGHFHGTRRFRDSCVSKITTSNGQFAQCLLPKSHQLRKTALILVVCNMNVKKGRNHVVSDI